MKNRFPFRYGRIGLFLIGLGVFSVGLGSLLRGHLFYQSFWGGAAFAPVVLLGGLAVMVLAVRKRGLESENRGRRGF